MVRRNINHFDVIHMKGLEIFERSFITKYIDVEFYKLLKSLGGESLEKEYSGEILDNFKNKYSVKNMDEFIEVFLRNLEGQNETDLRTVLFYILNLNTKDIFIEEKKYSYIVDERGISEERESVTTTLKRESIEKFYTEVLTLLEKDFDYKTTSMLLQCPNIYFDDLAKKIRGAQLFKPLIENMKQNNMPFDELVYSCYSCIEYITEVYNGLSLESAQVKEAFATIKDEGFVVISNLIKNADKEVYKEKHPIVYYMLIKIIGDIGVENLSNDGFIDKVIRIANVNAESDEFIKLSSDLCISESAAKVVKYLCIGNILDDNNYIEFMKLRDEVQYLYGVNIELDVNMTDSFIGVEDELDTQDDINMQEDNGDNIVDISNEDNSLPINEEQNEVVEDEENTTEESIESYSIEKPSKVEEKSNPDVVGANDLYAALMSMRKAQQNVDDVKNDNNLKSESTDEVSKNMNEDENSFVFTFI